ncbi:MAG TPA: hypothetical protein VMM37_00250 [Bacteroidota bacterium]|nr:hypothetical protein [Bacteroidota bacterium]
MEIEEIKAGVRELSVEDRRKVAVYILELEKEHAKKTIGPQIAKDVEDVSRVVQDAFEKLKKFVKNG